jgi:ABC-type oligopeptide transport system substrate-binding subunit
MNSKMFGGKMGFIAMIIVILAVMAGCGKQAASTESTNTALPSGQEQGAVSTDAPKNQVMSQKELELSMLFRGLLQMDNKGELIITKEQAESMLPIMSKSTEDGEITADNKQKLMALLTPEQKTFIDDLTARFKQFSGNRSNPNGAGGGARPALTDEQRAEFAKNRGKGQGPASDGQGGQGGQGIGGFGGLGQNVEQQLLDLLDSKINN